MGRLAGKIGLITGGNKVVELRDVTSERSHVVADLRDDLDRIIATIREAKGRLDVVFANAGIAETAPLGSITEASFDKLFDINVKGMLFTVQKALPLMRAGGSIILSAKEKRTAKVEMKRGSQAKKPSSRTRASGETTAAEHTRERARPAPGFEPTDLGTRSRERSRMVQRMNGNRSCPCGVNG